MNPKNSSIFAVVAVLTILVFGSLAVLASPQVKLQSTRVTTVDSVDGLELRATLNLTTVSGNRGVLVIVQEYNPTAHAVNVSKGESWASSDLRMTTCYASVFPFGIALYQGRYNAANVSGGKSLAIFPFVPCPLLLRLITGYYFEPQSNSAVVLPGYQGTATPMLANKTISGTYSTGENQQANPLTPGTYTVEIGDEWGTVSFLYFEVS